MSFHGFTTGHTSRRPRDFGRVGAAGLAAAVLVSVLSLVLIKIHNAAARAGLVAAVGGVLALSHNTSRAARAGIHTPAAAVVPSLPRYPCKYTISSRAARVSILAALWPCLSALPVLAPRRAWLALPRVALLPVSTYRRPPYQHTATRWRCPCQPYPPRLAAGVVCWCRCPCPVLVLVSVLDKVSATRRRFRAVFAGVRRYIPQQLKRERTPRHGRAVPLRPAVRWRDWWPPRYPCGGLVAGVTWLSIPRQLLAALLVALCCWRGLVAVPCYLVVCMSMSYRRLACRPLWPCGVSRPAVGNFTRPSPSAGRCPYLRKSALYSANVGRRWPSLPALVTLIFASISAAIVALPADTRATYSRPSLSVRRSVTAL